MLEPMRIKDIVDLVSALDGVLVLHPQPGDGTPQIAWGDYFFYYAPDGVVPRTQPFATIVTKDYPDDSSSRLDRPGCFRVNIAAGGAGFRSHLGHDPKETPAAAVAASASDILVPHPVYASMGWLCVVNPGPKTAAAVTELLQAAHHHARSRSERHARRRNG